MDLREALHEALTTTRDEIAALKKQQDEITDRLADLNAERRGLELALARHEAPTTTVESNGWHDLTRAAAIERILYLAGNPLGPKDITERLRSTGRNDQYPLVSAGLAYLKKTGVAQQAAYGLWELAPEHRSPVGPQSEADVDQEEEP